MKKRLFSLVLSFVFLLTFILPNTTYAQNLSKGHYLVINSKTNKMGYFKDGYLVKEFYVATGKIGSETPKGKFKIVNKIKNRPYYTGNIPGGDPRNPLGDRWLGLHVGSTYGTTYGIHGTNRENSIGGNVSAGCIRMYNNDVRWLFEQIPVKSEVIIYDGKEDYSQAASKYGVVLSNDIPLNEKQLDVMNKFKAFSLYGPQNNPTIDLNDKNSLISTLDEANNILKLDVNGQKSERKLFVDAWNSLSKNEINHKEVSYIYGNYQRIITVVEAAQAVNAFYEKVNSYGYDLLSNPTKASKINSLSNEEFGTRGYAKKAYDKVVALGENESNSPRMRDLFDKYVDSVNFLYITKNLQDKNIESAKEKANNLKSSNLKAIANKVINNYSDIKGHWAEDKIKNAMNNNWVAKSNIFRPNDAITRVEFITIINNVFKFENSTPVSFTDIDANSWYYKEICTAVANGYIGGYEDNTFRPNEKITREEASSMIARLKGSNDTEIDKLNSFSDGSEVSDWAKTSFEGAIENGYLNGYTDNTLKPKNNITRAEAIVTIERISK